jgi:nitroimidazol reductase NimA-like FMN-containing flavoprotein (pyridoxamine 5'-phosphate oxidase superfamily)
MSTLETTGTRRIPVGESAHIFGFTAPGPQLEWDWVEKRLTENTTYWLATTQPDGTPHVRPLWAFWKDDALYFCTVNRSVDYLNSGKTVTLHLERGDEVVLVEGKAVQLTTKAEHEVISTAYLELFNHRTRATDDGIFTEAEGYGGRGHKLVPTKVLAWEVPNFATATRWTFPA